MALISAVRALGVVMLTVLPRVREHLASWSAAARSIPDSALRQQALHALESKASNAEAAAVFATLAPRRARGRLVALLVGLQVLTDFLDTASEEPCRDPLRNGLELHRALVDTVEGGGGTSGDYYAGHRVNEDGGYVASLVQACRAGFEQLPSKATVRPYAMQAAARCAAGQSYTHAALHGDAELLESWAKDLPSAPGYCWWEIAAGASSSVAVHALIAAAADRRTTAVEAARIDMLYFMSVGSLTVLLDNLVDHDRDRRAGGHNYLDYYAGPEEAGRRLASIVEDARLAARALRLRRRRHEAIVAGVLGFYLSAPEARTPYARVIASQLLERASRAVWLILFAMRVRRRLSR